MGTQRQRLRATITVTMTPGFFLFSGFISMKENDKKNQGAFYDLCFEGKRPKIKALTSRTAPTRPLLISWQPSQVVFGSSFAMHVPGVGGIHCSYHLHVRGRHQDRQPHARTTANRDSRTHSMSKELPQYTCCSCTLSPSPHSWLVPSH
jgi:hypothetical protein